MTDDAADARLGPACAEPLDRLRLVVRRPPHARALREHLHAVAADRLDPVDRRVDSPAGGHVRAEFHRRPTIERWRASASAWLRAQPGFLHIGNVRTVLFNWLFARHEGGECLLRIENTDTNREVRGRPAQIQESLRWLGIDWDGAGHVPARQRSRRARELAHQLLDEGKAYEDEGAIRFRMPDEGVTVLGRRRARPHRVPNKQMRTS